ncbi:hypothetical protein SMGD1_1179 [Sulfurimonas gotlandica GD1]|jgi:hypothetical protein|uniref:Uncharacterized protein n=1 Tax=Sulfurimonas gotlandica (strain DSM 19862 / JCM 16533 / GD1) TaxID=929558 RepID=B6BGS1_SULGG|nr:hypothetical protein [Sulfurimonas gotlandica]EDZ63611.1 hypothetical protein CBGD1_1231 [Sulfurimonas gotlandica GD1]EHP29703.1 hypothetical protein SMGD1_1179 [Sulfurimonas gotlandica GD1]
MDLTIIEDEIYKFNRVFFAEVSEAAERCLNFIEQNNLHIPKENYTIVGDFLNTTLRNFRVLDSTFMSSTLKKLNADVKYLKTLYDETIEETHNVKEIFESEFIASSPSFSHFAREVLKAQSIRNPTDEQRKERKKLSAMLLELKDIYYSTFEEIFNDDKKYFLESLMLSLNSKTYYLDRLLWKEATASIVITKHFQVLKIKNKLNTRDYLLYTTGLMRPYTKEYQYLQSCLRIYK